MPPGTQQHWSEDLLLEKRKILGSSLFLPRSGGASSSGNGLNAEPRAPVTEAP